MISVIMPTYNEAGNIEELVERTEKTLQKETLAGQARNPTKASAFGRAGKKQETNNNENFEIIVVDDNSPDGTSNLVKKLQKGRPYLRLVTRTTERGLPTAVERGIKESKGEVVAWFDCDLSVAPEQLAGMIPYLEEADIVLGSRFVDGGGDVRGVGYSKDFSKFLNDLARMILSPVITDYTSGLIMAKKKALEGTIFDGVHGTYFMGMIYRAYKKGWKIKEVPYVFGKRGYGESKIVGFKKYVKTGLGYLKALIVARIRYSKISK